MVVLGVIANTIAILIGIAAIYGMGIFVIKDFESDIADDYYCEEAKEIMRNGIIQLKLFLAVVTVGIAVSIILWIWRILI